MSSETDQGSKTSPDRKGADRVGVMVGLAAFALVASFIPILSVPAAVSALVMAIRRARNPAIRFPVLAAMAMVGISLPVAITSAISGVIIVDEMAARKSIHRVHVKMDQVMAVEIQSGKQMQQMVRQLATIDVSDCPGDYQEAYRELIEVFTILAFHAARNEEIGTKVKFFLETLIESFGGDLSALEDIRIQDEQLQLRLELVANKLRLVCAKYGIVMTDETAH